MGQIGIILLQEKDQQRFLVVGQDKDPLSIRWGFSYNFIAKDKNMLPVAVSELLFACKTFTYVQYPICHRISIQKLVNGY